MSLCSGITHKQMMISGSSNNHKNHGQVGQEVAAAARSPDAPAVPDDVENGGQEVDRLPPKYEVGHHQSSGGARE